MHKCRRVWSKKLLAIGLLFLCPTTASATNGMNMIGYGAVSSGLGGADLAIIDNASAMNINPAGICGCRQQEIGIGLSAMHSKVNHRDDLGNDKNSESLSYLPMITYAAALKNVPLTVGLGFFSQGGMGIKYERLVTPFAASGLGTLPGQSVPNTDKAYTNVQYAKLTPTLAWHSPEHALKLGVGLNLGYARTALKYFPNTSIFADGNGDGDTNDTNEMAFAGMDMKGLSSFGYGARLGFQYRMGALTLGGSYLSKSKLDFDDGTMELNMEAAGLGRVRYDAKLRGFTWPQQAGLGASYRINRWLRVAADVDWIDWSEAMETLKIKLDHPNRSGAPSDQEIVFPMNWKDQWVYAIGIEITTTPASVIRLGYNHADSPVPDENLTPLFPAIVEDHVTAGAGFSLGQWETDLAVEWALPTKQKNPNPDPRVNPFGTETLERHNQLTFHLAVSRIF